MSQHQRGLGDVENCSTKTARKRHRTLSPHTSVTPTVASSRSAMSAKIRCSIGGNLPAPDGIRGMRPRLWLATSMATVLGRFSRAKWHQEHCAVPQLPAKDLHPARALASPPRLRSSWSLLCTICKHRSADAATLSMTLQGHSPTWESLCPRRHRGCQPSARRTAESGDREGADVPPRFCVHRKYSRPPIP